MNFKIQDGFEEYEKGNYEKALEYFEEVEDEESVGYLKLNCLLAMERYNEGLKMLNSFISKDPYEISYWFKKASCHISLNQDSDALKALSHIERLIEWSSDKEEYFILSKLFFYIHEYEKSLKYCNEALFYDKKYYDALLHKSVLCRYLEDEEGKNDAADKLMSMDCLDSFELLPVLTMKLLDKDYESCWKIINEFDDDLKEMYVSLFVSKLVCDLNTEFYVESGHELSNEDCIEAILEFHKTGKKSGEINGTAYFLV